MGASAQRAAASMRLRYRRPSVPDVFPEKTGLFSNAV